MFGRKKKRSDNLDKEIYNMKKRQMEQELDQRISKYLFKYFINKIQNAEANRQYLESTVKEMCALLHSCYITSNPIDTEMCAKCIINPLTYYTKIGHHKCVFNDLGLDFSEVFESANRLSNHILCLIAEYKKQLGPIKVTRY